MLENLKYKITTSLNDAINKAEDPKCTPTNSGETEQELFHNAKNHATEEHGMTAEFVENAKKNEEK